MNKKRCEMKIAEISKNKNTTGWTVLFKHPTGEIFYNDIYATLADAKKDCKGFKIIKGGVK